MSEIYENDQGGIAQDLAGDVDEFPAPDRLEHLEDSFLLEANKDIKALRVTLNVCLKFIETQGRAIKRLESTSKLLDTTNNQLIIQVGKVLDMTRKHSESREDVD